MGSKSAQLGEIRTKVELPAPDGFAISGWAYKHFLDANNAATANADEVRSVQITLVAKTAKKDNNYTSSFSYQDLQGNTYVTAGDGYRRSALSMQVNCRNLGL